MTNGHHFIARWDEKKQQNGVPKLTAIGEYTQQCVKQIPKIHTDVEIPIFTVMPNHIHLIVVLRHTNRRAAAKRQPDDLQNRDESGSGNGRRHFFMGEAAKDIGKFSTFAFG
ncbi:MAG: hypothetical protein J6S82_05340 [Bacteroidales bacterium]|nr:hypothetical protein [Bacteroidales bacterium]